MADRPDPRAAVMRMLTAAWTSQALAATARLDVPDLLARQGPLSARELTDGHVLPPLGDTAAGPAKFLDLHMMVLNPGKERTEDQWRTLFDSAGLYVGRITLLDPDTLLSAVEGARRGD
jgi:hypothetical protein